MRRVILLLVAILFSSISLFAQKSADIEYGEKYEYEKRNGELKVKALVAVEESSNYSATFNGESVECGDIKDGRLEVWLPLVGQDALLTINNSVKQIYTPLIPSDWGYFKNGTIHVISSSHQDIGWMNTPDTCRHERIHDIIDPALQMMKTDKDYAFGMEQTLNLMEFLEEYPDRKDEVAQRYREDRFAWGATFNQPYEGLESGEQLVRQMYFGRKWIKENIPGADDVTAYNIDVPGRTWQMPQILAKGGIKNLFISRMREGLYDWYSPDGSKVFTFTPGNYGWAAIIWKYLDKDAVHAFSELHHRSELWSDYFRERNIPPHYAVVISNDGVGPANYKELIDEWNQIVKDNGGNLPTIKHSTPEAYFNKVRVEGAQMEVINGERPDIWAYIHGPGHSKAVSAKREAAVSIPAAEAFSTFNSLLEGNFDNYDRAKIDEAWMASIYPDHGWGGKNGHITDSLFRASLELSRDLGNEVLNSSLQSIATKVNVKRGTVMVYNDLTWSRTERADVAVASPNYTVKSFDGTAVPQQLVKCCDGSYSIAFLAEEVPSMGYKSYYLSKGTQKSTVADQISNYFENDFYKITLGDGGIKSIYDKELKREILITERFAGGDVLNMSYAGNGAGEFVQFVTPFADKQCSDTKSNWEVIESGDLFTKFRISTKQEKSTTKDGEKVTELQTTIIQDVVCYNYQKQIDVDITLKDFDGTHGRQFRMALPLNMKEYNINYEVPMGVAQVGRDEMKDSPGGWAWGGKYVQKPAEIHPREMQNFISASGDGFGVTMSLPVVLGDWVDPTRESVDYPVLQGILLSSHKSCHGEGNWYSQAGTHKYNFSITSHPEGWKSGYNFGVAANHPLRAVVKSSSSRGKLPKSFSFVEIDNPFTAISTIKKADNSDEVLFRFVEMSGENSYTPVKLFKSIESSIEANLIEDKIKDSSIKGDEFKLLINHHSIDTYIFKMER